jgi:hypothetical protein
MAEWRRPYAVNWLRQLFPFAVAVLAIFAFYSLGPFASAFGDNRWLVLRNPLVDVLLLWVLALAYFGARAGVYVGDGGVQVRVGFRRIVVPWSEIASAEIGEVPRYPARWQPAGSLGLVLVEPSGERRTLPVSVGGFTVYFGGRGTTPYVTLNQDQLKQVVSRINERAAGQHPPAAPPSDGWLFPPR